MNAENLTISVIIPAFEKGKTICEVLKQIERSTAFQTQTIFVDGCANGGTEEITKEEKVEMIKDVHASIFNHSAFFYLNDIDN